MGGDGLVRRGGPRARLVLWLYPLFRTTLGVMSCSVFVCGPGATELWQQPYYRQYWHQPIPAGFTLSDFTLDTGLSYRCEAPLASTGLASAGSGEAGLADAGFAGA